MTRERRVKSLGMSPPISALKSLRAAIEHARENLAMGKNPVVGSFEMPQLAPRILRWLRQGGVDLCGGRWWLHAVIVGAIIRYLAGTLSAWHVLLRQGGALFPRIFGVRRDIARVFLAAVVVLLATAQSPSGVLWGKGSEKTRNVMISESVEIPNKSLTENTAVSPSLWTHHLPNIGRILLIEQVGSLRKWTVGGRNCADWQQAAPILHRVDGGRSISYALYDGIDFLDLFKHGGSPSCIDEFIMQTPHGVGVRNDQHVRKGEARLGNFEKDIGTLGIDNGISLSHGGIGSQTRRACQANGEDSQNRREDGDHYRKHGSDYIVLASNVLANAMPINWDRSDENGDAFFKILGVWIGLSVLIYAVLKIQ